MSTAAIRPPVDEVRHRLAGRMMWSDRTEDSDRRAFHVWVAHTAVFQPTETPLSWCLGEYDEWSGGEYACVAVWVASRPEGIWLTTTDGETTTSSLYDRDGHPPISVLQYLGVR